MCHTCLRIIGLIWSIYITGIITPFLHPNNPWYKGRSSELSGAFATGFRCGSSERKRPYVTVGIGPFLVFFLVLGLAIGRNGDIAHGVRPFVGSVHVEGWSRRCFIILGSHCSWRQPASPITEGQANQEATRNFFLSFSAGSFLYSYLVGDCKHNS